MIKKLLYAKITIIMKRGGYTLEIKVPVIFLVNMLLLIVIITLIVLK